MTRVAVVDCGTNSIRLLVADIAADGTVHPLHREMAIVRLGEGVDQTGCLSVEAVERTVQALETYVVQANRFGARVGRFVATSASRDASNFAHFSERVAQVAGVLPECISGEEEAALSFRGAVESLGEVLSSPVVVVDIGGGSTEVVLGETSTPHPDNSGAAYHPRFRVLQSVSVNIGCVRLAERHSQLPAEQALSAASEDISQAWGQVCDAVEVSRARALVGLAGSVTTVTAMALNLPTYDSERIDGATLEVSQVVAACEALRGMSVPQRLELGFMHPGRADVVGMGALIWQHIVENICHTAGLGSVTSSERDILDGMAAELVFPATTQSRP